MIIPALIAAATAMKSQGDPTHPSAMACVRTPPVGSKNVTAVIKKLQPRQIVRAPQELRNRKTKPKLI